MAEKPRYRALASIDPQELAQFQAGIRKRYTDEQIVAEIVACAERLGRSPTMREFAADSETAEASAASGARRPGTTLRYACDGPANRAIAADL